MKTQYPCLIVDLNKIRQNAKLLTRLADTTVGAKVFGVTKVLSGNPEVALALLEGGCYGLADSRLENLRAIRLAVSVHPIYGDCPLMLLRLPAPSQVEEVVETADISLNSELETLQLLSQAAQKKNRIHQAILMVDLGDLREGIWCGDDQWEKSIGMVREIMVLPSLRLIGIGTNLACYGGVIPDRETMSRLLEIAARVEELAGYRLEIISGGNSSSVPMLYDHTMPAGINSFRLGESIILGKNVIDRSDLPGTYQDAAICQAEIIELKMKPSLPSGHIGQNAFGEELSYVDQGIRQRAILALGRQDVVFEGLKPRDPGHVILGASSDHLLVDVTDGRTQLKVGDVISFIPNYGALLALSTSPYIRKYFRNP